MEIAFGLFYLVAACLAGFILPELIFIHGASASGKMSKVPMGINRITAFVALALVTYLLRK